MAYTPARSVMSRCRAGVYASAVLSVFLMLMATLSASSANCAVLPAPDVTAAGFEPGRQAVFVVPRAGALSIGMAVSQWQKAEILIEGSEPGFIYTIFSPDGKKVRSGSIEEAGWLAVSFPTSVDGLYRLVVRSKPQTEDDRDFQIRAELLPFATAREGQIERAEFLYSQAEALRNALRAGDVREAIAKYKQAASGWEIARDREAQVLALSGEALAWLELSEYNNAIGTLDRAIAISAGSVCLHSWLLNLEAQVFLVRWDSRSASVVAAQALRLSSSLNDTELEAEALVDQGASEWLTHSESAPRDIDEALRMARESGSTGTVALALRYKAWIEEDQGHLTRALSLMQQAEEYFRKMGDGRDVLQAMSDIADIEGLEGDRYSALLRNSRLVSPMMESGNTANYATVVGNIGSDYVALNRDLDAIPYLQKAALAFRNIHHDSWESISLGQLCMVELRLKHLNEALRDCQRSAGIVEQIHDPKRIAITTWRLGKVRQAFGQIDLAVENYRRAASLSEKVPDPRFESQSLIDWGDVIETSHKREEALPLFQKALSLSEQAEDSTVQLEARFRIARWYAHTGEDADAISELQIALGQIERKRGTVHNGELQASYLAAVRKCHQLYVDILMREHQRNRASPSNVLALEISESARARTLLDSLKARDLGQPPSQSEDPSAERIKLQIAIEQAYDRRLKLMLEDSSKRELQENSATLTQAIDSLQRMEDADRDDATAIPPSGRPLSAQAILQASKTSPATLLEYALGAEQSYLWVVHDGTINSYVLNARQEEIKGLVARWRKLAATHLPKEGNDAERELQGVAAKLSCLLLNNYIGPQNEKLAIVADGELAAFPFAALPLNGCGDKPGPPVVTVHQVVMIPSLSIFLSRPMRDTQTRYPKEVAIVANPVFDPGDPRVHMRHEPVSAAALRSVKDVPALPRLIGTGEEAIEIQQTVGPEKASVFLGFNASVESILSPEMRNYRILHLATHGVADESTPGFSGLILSLVSPDGRPVFGYLKTHDIANLDLHPELVVLSACDSGAGNNLSGEGVTGLAYAFLHAGARQVASTLWDVDDEITKDLMINFYKEMYSAGLDPVEALRQSQILMMQTPHRSAPYYWAGFEITSIGN
jgi:CHAT domain-containing protein